MTIEARVLRADGELHAGIEDLPARLAPFSPFLGLRTKADLALFAFVRRGLGAAPDPAGLHAPVPVRSARALEMLRRKAAVLLYRAAERPAAAGGPPALRFADLDSLASLWSKRLGALAAVLERGYRAVAVPFDDDMSLGYALYSPRDLRAAVRAAWVAWAKRMRVPLYEGRNPDLLGRNLARIGPDADGLRRLA